MVLYKRLRWRVGAILGAGGYSVPQQVLPAIKECKYNRQRCVVLGKKEADSKGCMFGLVVKPTNSNAVIEAATSNDELERIGIVYVDAVSLSRMHNQVRII